jgi:hypothetical protein
MGRESWTVDGWTLTQGLVRDLEYRAGLYRTPAAEGADGNVSNRTGRIWRPKTHGPGSFVLAMWIGDAVRSDVEALYDEMLRAVVHPHRLSVYRRTLADGTIRECSGDVIAAIEPSAIGQSAMRMGIEVNVPEGYWRGTYDKIAESSLSLGWSTQDVSLWGFSDSTAPMEHLTFRIDGPIQNPRVGDRTDGVEGEWFQYMGTIPQGQALIVNSSTWAVTGSGGFVPNLAALNYSGRRFLPVVAAPPGAIPKVRITGTGTNNATRLTVTGREAFLL